MAFDVIVFSQEELLRALEAGARDIALCDNTFVIPEIEGVHYTVIGNVTLEGLNASVYKKDKPQNQTEEIPVYANIENKPQSLSSSFGNSFSSYPGTLNSSYTSSSGASYQNSYAYEYKYSGSYAGSLVFSPASSYMSSLYKTSFASSFYPYMNAMSFAWGGSFGYGGSFVYFGSGQGFGYSYEFGGSYGMGFGGSFGFGYMGSYSGSGSYHYSSENSYTGSYDNINSFAGTYNISEQSGSCYGTQGFIGSNEIFHDTARYNDSGIIFVNGYGINLI